MKIRGDKGMKLIIQIPCYNEAETLEIALNALPKKIEGIDVIEVLIINDGSKDNTVEVARNWGVNYVVNFRNNKGLAKGFMAGIDACLRNGADIIVNTDADNQYNADDIEKLVRPVLNREAGMVIGERPVLQTKHWSPLKKVLQKFGSWVVRKASGTHIPDAPSGFRAYSRSTAMRLNVINDYTYTLETIVQAGRNKMAVTSVPIRTNDELRPSRLFSSMFGYVKKSMLTIVRTYISYKPMLFFTSIGSVITLLGLGLFLRFFIGGMVGKTQSVVVATGCLIIGILVIVIGFLADTIHTNRRLLEEIQFQLRGMDYGRGNTIIYENDIDDSMIL